MLQKPADEFLGLERLCVPFALVVLIAKRDVALFQLADIAPLLNATMKTSYSSGCCIMRSSALYSSAFFVIRYHMELILIAPLLAGFFSYYLSIGFRPNRPLQTPERLYKDVYFLAYIGFSFLCFSLLLFMKIPFLYGLSNVIPNKIEPLWVF